MASDQTVALTAPQHQALFAEFCRRKLEVNGPDVHMKTAGAGILKGTDRLWHFGVYNSLCSTPPAAAVWARWTRARALRDSDGSQLTEWLRENWKGVPVRKNRRPARSPAKLARCLTTLAFWVEQHEGRLPGMTYEEAWKSLGPVFTFGRYVQIKFLESLRDHMGYTQLVAPDIRAAGGWSPRRALSFLYPDSAELLNSRGNSRSILAEVHAIAADARNQVSNDLGYEVSFYELEALLCNYRQTLSGTFYPGRTIDSELEYHHKVQQHFGADPYRGEFDFFEARRQSLPRVCLGEVQGWVGVRKELWEVTRQFGYVWTDVQYDYHRTKDLSQPVRRDAA